jgi:hypothetical protein
LFVNKSKISQFPSAFNESGEYSIKQEPMEVKTEIKCEVEQFDDPMISYNSIYSGDFQDQEDLNMTPEPPRQPEARKKGRPKGAKNGTGKKSTINRPVRPPVRRIRQFHAWKLMESVEFQCADKLPKMKSNVQRVQLNELQKEELKKRPWFLQMGICYQIAPKLHLCKECNKVRNRNLM